MSLTLSSLCWTSYALVGLKCLRPRLEPLWAGPSRALPRPPSTRLGCHAWYICIFIVSLFCWTKVSPLGTVFPALFVYTVNHPLYVLFTFKASCCCLSLIKEGSVAAVDQSHNGEVDNILVHFPSIHPTNWMVHSWCSWLQLQTKVFIFYKCLSVNHTSHLNGYS